MSALLSKEVKRPFFLVQKLFHSYYLVNISDKDYFETMLNVHFVHVCMKLVL